MTLRTPQPSEYESRLLVLIDAVLADELSFSIFEKEYYKLYTEQVPSGALTGEQLDLFGEAQLKLDFTAMSPDEGDRRYGWIDQVQYLRWLRGAREAYRARFGR